MSPVSDVLLLSARVRACVVVQQADSHVLCAADAGAGRAGTETTLFGSHGSRYIGQVLSGRPHGVGQYWAQVRSSPNRRLLLMYCDSAPQHTVQQGILHDSRCMDEHVHTITIILSRMK